MRNDGTHTKISESFIEDLFVGTERPDSNSTEPGEHLRPDVAPSLLDHGMHSKAPTAISRGPPVLELTSLIPGSGKTHLLYLMTAMAVLPQTFEDKTLGGLDTVVIILDVDDRFDVHRLANIINAHVGSLFERAGSESATPSASSAEAEDTVGDLVRKSLQHVHIFRPQSLPSLLAQVADLEAYLLDISRHHSSDKQLGAIILDSASVLYWQHRADEDAARLEALEGRREVSKGKAEAPSYSHLMNALKRAREIFECAIVYTCSSTLSPQTSDAGAGTTRTNASMVPRPLLPPAWASFPTLRLFLYTETVPAFTADMSAEEAWKERTIRQAKVEHVCSHGEIRCDSGVRRFKFSITGEGIVVKGGAGEKEPV